MRFSTLSALFLAGVLFLSGCQLLNVYTIDLPQGTPLTQNRAAQIQAGMSQIQVLNLLGSPALRDSLNPNRWDYLYDYTAGTEGKRQGKENIKNASQYFSVYFDQNGNVTHVQGLTSLPTTLTTSQ